MLALGLIMAFGAGVLISAVAYELVQEEIRASVTGLVIAAGLLLGACVFFAGDSYIDHLGGRHRKRSSGVQAEGSPLALPASQSERQRAT
jgi:ZIP family zinc transporter